MEPAKDLVERPLPSITLENCSLYPSTSYEIISPRFFHLWEGFAEEVLEICASLDLNTLVPLTHDEDNEFVVASKRGLIGRMEKHLCDPVIKTLSVTDLSDFRFGDYQALHGYNPENVPELLLLTLSDGIARLVLEMKTCWTLKLQHYPVSAGYAVLVGIKHHLGELFCPFSLCNIANYHRPASLIHAIVKAEAWSAVNLRVYGFRQANRRLSIRDVLANCP